MSTYINNQKAVNDWNRKPYSYQPAVKKIDCSKKRTFDDVLVTPNLARAMLNTMVINRKLRPKYHEYARAMEKGRFDCAEAISFDYNGHLINGQHRLNAVIEANMPVRFEIKVGLSPDTIFDRGAMRTLEDENDIRGIIPNDLKHLSVVSMVNSFLEFKFPHRCKSFNEDDKADFINAYADDIRRARRATSKGSAKSPCKKGAIMAGILAAEIYGIDSEILGEYCSIANSGFPIDGVNISAQSAPLLMMKYADDPKRYGITRMKLCCITEMTIRDFVNGTGRKILYRDDLIAHVYMDKIEIKF